jgi:hypothetical protein
MRGGSKRNHATWEMSVDGRIILKRNLKKRDLNVWIEIKCAKDRGSSRIF